MKILYPIFNKLSSDKKYWKVITESPIGRNAKQNNSRKNTSSGSSNRTVHTRDIIPNDNPS